MTCFTRVALSIFLKKTKWREFVCDRLTKKPMPAERMKITVKMTFLLIIVSPLYTKREKKKKSAFCHKIHNLPRHSFLHTIRTHGSFRSFLYLRFSWRNCSPLYFWHREFIHFFCDSRFTHYFSPDLFFKRTFRKENIIFRNTPLFCSRLFPCGFYSFTVKLILGTICRKESCCWGGNH